MQSEIKIAEQIPELRKVSCNWIRRLIAKPDNINLYKRFVAEGWI